MGYLSRLRTDLDRWIDQGWVDASRRDAILADAGDRHRHWTATGALTLLGASLLALSALTFVAANWDGMPRLARFGVILVPLWLALTGAGQAFDRKAPALGHALAVLGVALFGVAILLTAQTFNMASFRNTAVLIWCLAGLATAILLPSRPVLILSAILGAIWAGLEFANPFVDGALWSYLPLWLGSLILAVRLQSRVTLHLLALALVLWIGHGLTEYGRVLDMEPVILQVAATLVFGAVTLGAVVLRDRAILGAGSLAAWMAVSTATLCILIQPSLADRSKVGAIEEAALYLPLALPSLVLIAGLSAWRVRTGRSSAITATGLGAAALGLFLLPFAFDTALDGLGLQILIGALIYTACVALILAGNQTGSRATGVIGICAFIGQTLYVYFETFGGLLDTALFFLVGGLILFALGFALMRWQARRPAGAEGEAS